MGLWLTCKQGGQSQQSQHTWPRGFHNGRGQLLGCGRGAEGWMGERSFREDIFGLEDAHVAFYVGVELTAKDGADLGMLCASPPTSCAALLATSGRCLCQM